MKLSVLKGAVKVVAAALAGGLFVRTLAALDLSGAAALLVATGPALALAFVPFLAVMALDTAAWGRILRTFGRTVPFGRLLGVRLATEAIHLSLPGGAVVADGLNPFLLHVHGDVPLGEAAVSVGARKWLIMRGHGVYILVCGLLGYAALARCSPALFGRPGLPFAVVASACVPLAASSAMGAAFRGRSLVARASSLLGRLPIARLRRWLARREASFHATDRCMALLGGAGQRGVAVASAMYVGTWLLEGAEGFLIARLVGVPVSFGTMLAIEGGLSLLRSVALFAPAGIGVQDLGYVLFFRAVGVVDASAASAAFLLVKRTKEACWIGVGYALLAALRSDPQASTEPSPGRLGGPSTAL